MRDSFLVLVCGSLLALPLPAQQKPDSVQADLRILFERVSAKLKAEQRSADQLAPETAEYEALLAKYRGDSEAEAAILLSRASYAIGALRNEADARHWLERILREHPTSPRAESARKVLHAMTPEGKAEAQSRREGLQAARDRLFGHPAPRLDFTWSSRPGLRTLDDLRGQVVVLDFWATWCAPCIASFPEIRADVDHFSGSAVTFLGVTSLQGRVHGVDALPIDTKDDPAREHALMTAFMEKHEMTWPVVFTAQQVFNGDYAVGGIPYVVIIAPDGTVRAAGLHPGESASEIKERVTAILREFNLPLPEPR